MIFGFYFVRFGSKTLFYLLDGKIKVWRGVRDIVFRIKFGLYYFGLFRFRVFFF